KTILPDDYSIIVAEANIYILQGNMDEAQKLLELAIQKNPTNYILYYVIGTNYSNKLDQMVYENNPELYSKFYDMAEKYYKECLKLKPDMVEANFNLGALYFNEGLRILKQANNITDPIKLEQNEKMFKEKWEQATPYLEKALELQPNDISTLQTLRNLYARTNKLEKAQELDKKIKEINKK
ncbi:MAG TPA: tetratricopeptide repeat protein, partial [Bacteroidales bacterium]|nr:tetratricopeptide repeat protein [Bacteroidales bacterium]